MFVPSGVEKVLTLFVCEGPTDTAALLGIGLSAVGRPSNVGGHVPLVWMIQRLHPRSVTVMADRDGTGSVAESLTLQAARALICDIETIGIPAKILRPPLGVKDSRDWIRAGAKPKDFLE